MILSLTEILLMNGSFLDTHIIIYNLENNLEKRKRSITSFLYILSCTAENNNDITRTDY